MPDTSTEVAIATTTLGSAAATITFSSIPSTYTDLRLVVAGTTSGSLYYRLRFNGDTSALYSKTYLAGNGTTATSSRISGDNRIDLNSEASVSATQPHLITVDVFSYAGSTNKTCLISFSQDLNGSGVTERSVGLWRSTSAITEVGLSANTSSFAIGTTATLYGIL